MIDTDQQDHEFFDILYQQWSKTSWAEEGFWVVEEYQPGGPGNGFPLLWALKAVKGDKSYTLTTFEREEDADFTAGLHGAVPDLIRRLHEAIDEATSKDEARDQAEANLAEAYLENQGLRQRIEELEKALGE
ncbi:hypothetical protein SEA_PAINTERBOY_41 [Mycobacterium phage PainterBoy]|nr:hypothetical protein SEA_LUCYEDI_41 [Mycobacterium phage Lucyedi]QNJ55829.1 hypothetical protein SEA_PAINTERBOY_41 [Mycobacterium phage PainterBoy]